MERKLSGSKKKYESSYYDARASVPYVVGVIPIPQAKHNAINIYLDCMTTPHHIERMLSGCDPDMEDPNPAETAFAAAFIKAIKENCIVFKNTKNQQIEVKYMCAWGTLSISLILPGNMTAVKQGFNVLKKAIKYPTIVYAYHLYNNQHGDGNEKRKEIYGTAINILNNKNEIRLYLKGDSAKHKDIAEKIEDALPSSLRPGEGKMHRKLAIPKGEAYSEFKNFDKITPEVRALVITALQVANMDFFTDYKSERLFLNKQHLLGNHIRLITNFLKARTRFLDQNNGEAKNKKLATLPALVYLQSATTLKVHNSMQKVNDNAATRQLEKITEDFKSMFY